MPDHFTTAQHRRIAYHQSGGQGPGVVFLGGLQSDMTGTKAMYLQAWAEARGQRFLRFDYSGHGQSSGTFLEGTIGDWAEDARAAISELTEGPQILVGSSMGGWISLLMARAIPERISGLIGVAAAPDFTEDGMWAKLSEAQRAELIAEGRLALLQTGTEPPTTITKALIENGRRQLVLRAPLDLPFPVRLLQGMADDVVLPEVAIALAKHARCPDLRLTLVKGADHRFSTPECLELMRESLENVVQRVAG
jgi:pimeloyl-ACP methyl ester carboxylesterase